MALVVRSWNLFHGGTVPARRQSCLEEAVRRATEDRPALVCLQEVPVWALRRLSEWSGMECAAAVARRPSIGPLPCTAEVGRRLTALHQGAFRSYFAGQANAVLVGPPLRLSADDVLTLNPWRFRRAQARWLRLPPVARLAWAHERRVCQAVRARLPDGRAAVVGNLHATAYPADRRLADAEVLRAAAYVDALARPDEVCVLAGDLNLRAATSWTLAELTGPEWGFEGTGPGIDHVLVRGVRASPTVRWPDERRRLADGTLLSDHAPVERALELP